MPSKLSLQARQSERWCLLGLNSILVLRHCNPSTNCRCRGFKRTSKSLHVSNPTHQALCRMKWKLEGLAATFQHAQKAQSQSTSACFRLNSVGTYTALIAMLLNRVHPMGKFRIMSRSKHVDNGCLWPEMTLNHTSSKLSAGADGVVKADQCRQSSARIRS